MEELDEDKYSAYPVHWGFLSDYLKSVETLVLRCDSTENRRYRANSVSALKRAVERKYGVKLTKRHVSHSETHGFLYRTEVWYEISNG